MLKKLLIGSIILSILSLIVTISVMYMTYDRGIAVYEEEEKIRKEQSLEYFVNDVYSELEILTRAHAYWTLANDAVRDNDYEWIDINLSQYLYEGDFEIDALIMVKEDGSVIDDFGINNMDLSNTSLFNHILNDDAETQSLIWIDGELFIFTGMPLANDDASDLNGAFILGKALKGELLDYLVSIIEPEDAEQFHLYSSSLELSSIEHSVVLDMMSIDDDLFIQTRLQYSFANYIKDHLIVNTISIVSLLFLFNVGFYTVATVLSGKHRKILTEGMDSIQLSNKQFPRIRKNQIKEFDLIGRKVNDMLSRIEYDYNQLSKKNIEIVQLLSKANEINDLYTKEHSDHVSDICEYIGRALKVPNIDQLVLSAQLHDIGKVFIPLNILNKKGKLTVSEFDEIKKHPEYGFSILDGISNFEEINQGILYHHEKYDGSGYPKA